MSKSLHEAIEQIAEKSKEKWIQKAIKKPGALSKQLGVPEEENIPKEKLEKAAKKGGKLGKRARLAMTLKKLKDSYEPNGEELVYEYLSSYFGADLNESIDELNESDFEDAIIAVNTLRNAVNEYFELEEQEDPHVASDPRHPANQGGPYMKKGKKATYVIDVEGKKIEHQLPFKSQGGKMYGPGVKK